MSRQYHYCALSFLYRIYLFLEGGEGRERNIDV